MTTSWVARGGSAAEVKKMGYDTVRLHLYMHNDDYYNEQVALLPEVIRDCTAHGIDVVLNIRNDTHDYPVVEAEWEKLIPLYDSKKAVIAYELVNEPWDNEYIWKDYVHGMVDRLRLLTDKTFIIASGYGPIGDGFDTLTPIDDNNIIYTFHMYWPYPFTMQGLRENPTGLKWHGEYYGADRDRGDILYQDCRWAIAFQKQHNVKISITELGCSVHCDDKSSNQWFADVLGICREFEWDYFIHTYPMKDFRLPKIGIQ